ncbi:MAG TPA: oxidoreductase [Xanthomonadaceae bacterium]|jgi:hypothetical protein|nr:oxidoreductase [Xanthomonadaceae bacterium]
MAISLASISKTTRNAVPPRVIVHGQGGVGKSTFAASAYRSIFLPFEDGLSGIEVEAFPRLTSYDDCIAAIGALASDAHDFGTVVIDSLDWLEPHVWARVAAAHGKASIEDIPYGKGYAEALPLWRTIFDGLNHLREKRGMAVVLICHSQVKRFEAPDSEPFDRYELKLHKGASALAVEWADIVGFAHHETAIKKDSNGFQTRARGIATGRRLLRVVETPACVAKNRYALPELIELSWPSLMAAMNPAAAAA